MTLNETDKKIGIVAGGGDLPLTIAKEAKKNGFEVFVAGFEGFTDANISQFSVLEMFKLGKIQAPIDFFKKNNVKSVILIGNIAHVNIFSDVKPDLRGANLLFKLKDKSSSGIFKAVSQELEKDGIMPADTSMFLGESLAKKGVLAGRKVSVEEYKDIVFGFETAKKIADMDIGLSVAVKDMAVIAVEAMEGTDECIKRAALIMSARKKPGKFTLVKVARPKQDMRFDLPVIGERTVENMAEGLGAVIAVEAYKTLVVEPEKTFKLADEKGISIIGI